ncbi:hypothetical protein BJ741DRAFT_622212 [Chytriomyces cf. hyalinus JEL632]|nr:hypothetical protein BJ741DRAFT_622212 [Chytriomyces cf. hyalinus JEL632]
MNSLVTASQAASDGTVTATLILNDRYISALPPSIFNTPQEQQQLDSGLSTYTIAVTFNSSDAVDALCSGSATVGSSLVETCPLELGGVARRCVSVSCQSIPGKIVAANVRASFSVCPSGLASGCGLSDTAVGSVLGRIVGTRTTSAPVTLTNVKSKSVVTNEGESKANAQREGANNAVVPMSTSSSTLATGMAAPAVAAPAAKGAETGINLVVIIVPILVVLLAVAAGVYIYMKRRGSLAADADAEERGKISAVAKRKGSTDKEAITETSASVSVSQEETTQTSTPAATATTAPSIAETPKSKKQASSTSKNGAKPKPAVSTKPPNIDEPRVQTLAPGQVRYINVRGSPAPIPIPAPPASLGGTSMRSPTSTIGSASIFNIPAVPAQSFGYIYQGYTPNPNLPNHTSALPAPGIPPARANPYPGYYDQQGNYHFY